jgi:uncharacterized membrane protein
MTFDNLKDEIKNWRFTKYKLINLVIGTCSLLIYEFIARPYYRPYIYQNRINDLHIADTLGNTLGTLATIFILVSLLSSEKERGNYLIRTGTIVLVLYEIAQPLLGKPIDGWDILATLLTGLISYLIFNLIFKQRTRENVITEV